MTDDTSRASILGQLFDYVYSRLNSEQLKSSKCTSRNGKPKKECNRKKTEEPIDVDPCTEKRTHILPSQICPKAVSCCYIKMQDPYAPCCCEIKPELSPCPPKCYRQPAREPTCGCDLCRKGVDKKCCSSTAAYFRVAARDSREKP